jgi:hypothetical protein
MGRVRPGRRIYCDALSSWTRMVLGTTDRNCRLLLRARGPWTPQSSLGSLEAVGSGKDQEHGSGEEVPGRAEGTCRGGGA